MHPRSLFSLAEHLERLSKDGDPLEVLAGTVEFERFRPLLTRGLGYSDAAKGFVLLPRRWVVERTFAWLGRCRRLAKDWEKSIESSTAWTTIAHIRRLTRYIASHCQIQ